MDAQTVAKNNIVRRAFDEAVLIASSEQRAATGLNGPKELADRIWMQLQERWQIIMIGYAPDFVVDAEIADDEPDPEPAVPEAGPWQWGTGTELESALDAILATNGFPVEGYPLARTVSGALTPSGEGDRGDLASDLAEAARTVLAGEAATAAIDPEAEQEGTIQRQLAEAAPGLLAWFRARATPAPTIHTPTINTRPPWAPVPDPGSEEHPWCERCGVYVADEGTHVEWHEGLTIMMDALAGVCITSRERSV